MAKTHRRRAARIARQAAAANARATARTSRRAAEALLTNHDWKQLTEALDGLLRLEFPSPFTDLELLCPQEAWLVVDLVYVRVNTSDASGLRHAVVRVVDALEKICVHAETVRAWSDLYEAFWTRVLTSDMNQDQLTQEDPCVADMIRFMRAKGTHIALRWHSRRMQPAQVISPLQRLLNASANAQESTSIPVQISLRFEGCQLTTADLKGIHELLQLPSDAENGLLCHAFALKQLSLRSNAFYAHHLEALTAMLEDPTVRRIDSLGLEDTIPHDAMLPPTYARIFQRTVSMALRARAIPSDDQSLRLSFDDCKGLDVRLIEAIENALLQATRPVRALSLACVTPPDFGGLMRLMRLVLTPLPTATDDFELDISCVNADQSQDEVEEALVVSLAEMVTEAIPRIYSAGIAAGGRVTCRLLYPEAFEDQFLTVPLSVSVSTFELYEIVFVTHNGFFQVALPELDERGHRTTGWVSSTAIANIRIGDAYVVGSNCTSLILDGAKGAHSSSQFGRFVAAMAATTGACLMRLSLQSYPRLFNDAPTYMARCPTLIELNLCNTGSDYWNYKADWSQAPPDTGRLLQILNISSCDVGAAGLETLPALTSLKYLRLADNPLDDKGLECLLERMRASRSLECVNVAQRARLEAEHEQQYVLVKAQIEKHLRDEYVTLNARVALLSVMPHVEEALGLVQCVPLDILAAIFRFAGTRPRCVVCW